MPKMTGAQKFARSQQILAKGGRKLNKRQKKQVKRMIRGVQELKHITTITNNASVTNSPSIQGAFFDVPQGDSDSERDGDRIQWCGKMDLRFTLKIGDPTNVVRLLIIQWHPNNVPNVNEILADGPTGSIDVNSMYLFDNRQLYTVMWDKTYSMVGTTAPQTTSAQIQRRIRVSLRKARKNVQYVAGTLVGTNRFYLLTVSDSSAIAHPSLTLMVRTVFRDS